MKTLGILSLGICGFLITPAQADSTPQTLRLGWDAIPQAGISGYRIHVGIQSQQYEATYDTGLATSFPVGDLEYGTTYYFAVSSISSIGLESEVSEELAVTVARPSLPVGSRMTSAGAGQKGLQWTFPRSALNTYPKFIVEASSDLVNWTRVATVLPEQATGGDAQSLQFDWPIATTGTRMFYRLTAKNWMGESIQ